MISEKLNVSWGHSALGTIVMPLLFLPMNVTISIYESEEQNKDIIRMSILVDQRFVSRSSTIKKEDIINVGKLLSDKSKVDIL